MSSSQMLSCPLFSKPYTNTARVAVPENDQGAEAARLSSPAARDPLLDGQLRRQGQRGSGRARFQAYCKKARNVDC